MERASIVPDGNVVYVVPVESDLQIMIILEKFLKPLQSHTALLFGQAVDELAVLADWVETLPAGDRICPDDRMGSLEIATDILSGTARLLVQLEVSPFSSGDKVWTAKGAGETL